MGRNHIIEINGGVPGAWTYEVLNEQRWSELDTDERRAEIHRAVKRVQNRRRAARLRSNGPRERYTLQQIGDRDSWTCAICRARVDPAFTAPHPCSPSLHHVIEVARGGTDTVDNVTLAHRFCNSDSHAWGQRPPAEARARLADRVLYGKHGPGRWKRIPGSAAIALAAEIIDATAADRGRSQAVRIGRDSHYAEAVAALDECSHDPVTRTDREGDRDD